LLPDGFRHNEQSLRIVDVLERQGRGLNLSYETREGILLHSKTRESVAAEAWGTASTLEGQAVKLADSIAYLNHDVGDAMRGGLIAEEELPADVRRVLGADGSTRIATLVTDCVTTSMAAADAPFGTTGARIGLSATVLAATDVLREFMFERVYLVEDTLKETRRGQSAVRALFRYFEAHPESIPGWSLPEDPPWRRAADYVSGMTDGYALRLAAELGLDG
jgi:dGTPase